MKVQAVVLILVSMILCSLLHSLHLNSQDTEKEIVEHVSVNWWQVPVFAVDSSGKPITDLKAADIEVFVDGRRVKEFVFYKRAFSVSLAREESLSTDVQESREKAPVMKKNAIFLLFDLVLSDSTCIKRSKKVAQQIIGSASPDIHFVLASIEPFKGLHYICGPINEKKILLKKLESHIKPKNNPRTVEAKHFFAGSTGGEGPGSSQSMKNYTEDESSKFKNYAGFYYLRKSLSFFNAFDSLYLLFNSLDDNKFVYFFSEGLSNDMLSSANLYANNLSGDVSSSVVMGGSSMYNRLFRKAASRMGRSGAVLFIVNPMGVANDTDLSHARIKGQVTGDSPSDSSKSISGEDSLRFLAKESGGKYIEGVNTQVVKTLENMHRAYYEISFSDIAGLPGDSRDVSVKLKRKGVQIHTLRSLEKSKRYVQMDRMEQEVFVLNLVSRNTMLKQLIPFEHARITQMRTGDTAVEYTVKLPESFLRQNLDLYKFWVKDAGMETQAVAHLEKTSLYPRKRKVTIQCQRVDKNTRNTMPYFALIDGKNNKALVRVIGDSWIDDDKGEDALGVTGKRTPKSGQSISTEDLNRILDGAAKYCEKLKESAFHFLCKEEIAETRKPLSSSSTLRDQRTGRSKSLKYNRRTPNLPVSKMPKTTVKKMVFSYRLMKSGESIKEERQRFNVKTDRSLDEKNENVIKTTAFFSERAVFAPTTMLAADRQAYYRFTFLGYDSLKNRRCAMILGVPLDPHITRGFFGTTWIDLEDHSVLKVAADPRSIKGYSNLKELADKLKTRLHLSLEMNFDLQRDGIRFPTRVSMMEKYKGGRNISMLRGPAGWERTRTQFRYSDYRFFSVKSNVIIND